MAVHIRLARAGAKKSPFYRLVATDQRSPRGGRFLENLGTWDPKKDQLQFKTDRVAYWRGVGAVATATVMRLLKRAEKLEAAKATK